MGLFNFLKKTNINETTKQNDKIAIDVAKKLSELYEIINKEAEETNKKDRKYLMLRIKDETFSKNCTITNIDKFMKKLKEKTNTIGYELTTGWIIGDEVNGEWEDTSKILVKIDNSDIVNIDFQNETRKAIFDKELVEIESIIKNKYKKQVKINYITKEQSKTINQLKNNDYVQINLFNKVKQVRVFSTGDNQFDENGNYKVDDFLLNSEEIEVLNWFVENIKIDDYKKEIMDYCNDEYSSWQYSDGTQEGPIEINDVENEINITAIAINVTDNWKSNDGFIYPEISFYGNCKCDEEHGICIGFRDKKFLGIHSQDWTL
ncbi:MAG: hypothetical protein E7313_08105 [Clostridiales bacterium]|nr:hypothetical protein [Clostridiales bacterium]